MAPVTGLDRLRQRMRAMSRETRAEIRAALHKGAEDVAGMARRLAPKKSGALAASIKVTAGSKSKRLASSGDQDLSVRVTAGDKEAYYAAWVEFGTAPHANGGKFAGTQHPGTAAQPFFFPAYRASRKRVKSRISRAVTRAARKAATQ